MKINYFIAFQLSLSVSTLHAIELTDIKEEYNQIEKTPHIIAEHSDNSKLKANKVYSFDTRSFFGGGQMDGGIIQISRWNSVVEGQHSLQTFVNDRNVGLLILDFKHLDASSSAVLCVNQKLLALLDLKQEILERLPKKECLTIKELSPDAYYDYDQSILSLSISLPLVITMNRPKGYIPIERFDKGVSSAYLSYQYSHYLNQRDQFQNTEQSYLRLNAGLNFLGWNYKHNGYFDSEEAQLKKYHATNHQVSTDLLKIRSRVTLGEFNTQTYSMDSANIRGIQIASDISMLPSSQQYYAPLIKGMANTNALVSVFQNGQKIFERNVPAGMFEINDLSASAGSGDLTVQITEQGGEKTSFHIPLQGNMNLVRVGQINYSTAFGRYYTDRNTSNEYIAQLGMQYGFSNYLTMYGGTSQSKPFQSYHLGAGLNTPIGAFRLEADHANTYIKQLDEKGQRYKFFYNYHYRPLETYFNIQSTFQTQEYKSLAHVFSQLDNEDFNKAEVRNYYIGSQLKNQFSISLSQRLKDPKYGSFYLNASKSQYWGEKKNYSQLGLNYSNSWNRIYYSIGVSQILNDSNYIKDEMQYQLNLTMPLEIAKKRINVNSNISHSNGVGYPISTSLGFSGTARDNYQMSYSLSNNNSWNDFNNSSSISVGLNYNFSQMSIGVSSSLSDQAQQYGINLSGGLVAHPYGVTLANQLSDTFTIIHAKGAQGVRVNNSYGGKIDRLGNAIYNNLSPYSSNSIALDIRDLPLDINLKANQSQVIPRRYSSTLLQFNIEKSSNIILNIRLKDNVKIPMGTHVKTNKNRSIGFFGQSNQLFISDNEILNKGGMISWDGEISYSCFIEPIVKKQLNNNKLQILDIECR